LHLEVNVCRQWSTDWAEAFSLCVCGGWISSFEVKHTAHFSFLTIGSRPLNCK
jgi:hypothetical protein